MKVLVWQTIKNKGAITMLFNFDWLKTGELFPPRPEIPRMKSYRDNIALFEDNSQLVLGAYYKRLQQIIFGLKETDFTSPTFFDCPNYWQLISIKTADLVVGEKPNIMNDKMQDQIDKATTYADLFSKLPEMVIDNDSLGDCVVVPYIDEYGQRTFSVNNPGLWIPIVDAENTKHVIYDCMCWTPCVYQDTKVWQNNKYELHCKIQKRGESTYTLYKFKITRHYFKEYIDDNTTENCGEVHFFQIGSKISEEVIQAPYTQAVIHFPSVTTSRSVHGLSSYDRVTAIIGEIAIRQALANFILDQNSAPKMSAPEGAFTKNKDGRWVLKTSGRNFVVKPNEQPPIYITWDGNLTSNEARIADLKRELYAMSEMGTIISHDDINSSQGYEALEVKLTNPKLKARRIATKFDKPLKQLVSFLVGTDKLKEEDLSIIFNNGIPLTENQNLDMAIKKLQLGVSKQSVLVEFFGMSEEDAEKEVEKAREENADAFMGAFAGQNGLYENQNNGKEDHNNNDKEEAKDKKKKPPIDNEEGGSE